MNSYKIEWFDLVRLIKSFGYDDLTSEVVADYLDECTTEYNLTSWIWNVLPYFVQVFRTKDEAFQYIESEKLKIEDCTLYESDLGVYLEWD